MGVAFGSLRASLRSCRPFLRASTRVRRRVFFSGDGEGDALSVTAPFAGLGLGSGSAAKTLDCAIKPMAAARRRLCFIIIISGLSFKSGSFFPLKPGQPMLFSELIDQLQHAWAIACALQPRLDKPKGGLVVISFTLHPQLTLMNTSKHLKFQKNFACSSFHTQEITPGTIVFQIFNNITIIRHCGARRCPYFLLALIAN